MHACMHLLYAGSPGIKEQWRWRHYGKPFPSPQKSQVGVQMVEYGKPFPEPHKWRVLLLQIPIIITETS